MADIFKEITLTERNQAGPYFDVFYSTDCVNYTQSVDGNNVYLPTVGSTAVVTVPEETICIQLTSEGVCTNSVISGSFTTTTTTSTTTSTTTTTTAPPNKLLIITASNDTAFNFNNTNNDVDFTFVTDGVGLRKDNIPIGLSDTSSNETLNGNNTINSAFNVSGVSYGSLDYTASVFGDGSLLDIKTGTVVEPTSGVTIGHGIHNTDLYTTMSLLMELDTSPTTTTTTTTTTACSEWELFCPSNASGDCRFEVDCCDGSTVTYEMPPDSNVFACVIAGGTVTKLSASGIASPQGTSCSTDCGDVSTTTTTTTTSTTTSTTTTTTLPVGDCVEYELECRSGAVGGYCSFEWTDCSGDEQSAIIVADSNEYVCAVTESVSKTSTSGAFYLTGETCETQYSIAPGFGEGGESNSSLACNQITSENVYFEYTTAPQNGDVAYTNSNFTSVFVGDGNWFGIDTDNDGAPNFAFQINSSGVLSNKTTCV